MAIHCMLLTENNRRIVENFVSEFKDKYDCMQNLTMVKSMISAWQSANFKDGEEPTMPTKDEIEQFIQSQLGEDKSKTNATSKVTKIISGGQTGVDTIGLQVAKKLGIETGGTAPKGFLREKGIDTEDISSYGLTEISDTEQADYTKRKGKSDPYTGRTELNVRNSDGTVYFSTNADSAGRIATERSAREWNKPFLLNPTAEQLREWINTHNIKTLNIAGNRGSKLPANNRIADIITKALSPVQEYSNEKQSIIDKAKKNGTFMKAPNDQPTNLTEKQWVQVRTKAFKDWFGDWENDPTNASKVVDENGEPLVVYHNSNADINIFDKNKIGTNGSSEGGLFGEGFYFSTNKDYNNIFGNKEYAVFLNIKNPITDERTIKEIQAFKPSIDTIKSAYNKDGLIGINESENNTVEYVAYDSNQIKSAINNTGVFSKDSNDIYDTDSKETPIQDSNNEELKQNKYKPINSNNVFKHSLFRGQAAIPEIDKDGNLHLRTSYDSLSELKTLSFASKEEEAIHYGYRAAKNPYIIELNEDYLDSILPKEEYERDKVENKKPFRYDEESNEVRLSFNDEIIIPKGQYSISHNEVSVNINDVEDAKIEVFDLINLMFLSDTQEYTGVSELKGAISKQDIEERYIKIKEIIGEKFYDIISISEASKDHTGRNAYHNGKNIQKYINEGYLIKKDYDLFTEEDLKVNPPKVIEQVKKEWAYYELTDKANKEINKIIKENKNNDSKETLIQETTEKQDTTFIQEEAPIQEDNKSYAEDLARCARQMSPIERKHRVERITRMFSSIVNSKLKDKLATYNDKIQAETNPKVKNDLLFGRKKITRFSVIKSEGVQSIMMEVRKAFQVYVDAPLEAKIAIEKKPIKDALINLQKKKGYSIDEEAIDKKATIMAKAVVERKDTAFKNVLNNFQVLAEESLGNLALTEGISVNLNSNFVLNTQENSDTFNEEGKQTNQGDIFEKEESLKDGWMTDVRQVATFDSLTARVRQAIGNMVRYDSTGNVDRDDLGDNIYLNAGYVHSELIQALRNMVSAEDMIPMLEQLSKKKVWVKQIINELNNDNQLFTEFYRAYRKDYVNYFIQKVSTNSDTSTSTKVMSINGAEGTAHYFDEWRDNYEYGNVLTTDSIYDKNGDIQLKKAKVGLDLVDSLLDIFEDRETIVENLTDENIARIKKAMNMLGVSVDSETLENALKFNLDNKAFKPAVNVLLSNLRTIYYDLNKGNEKVKDGEYVDLLNIHGTAFNNIAEVINKVDEDTIESSVRQGDKTMYAHINPSYVTTLIKKLQREDTYKQVLDDYRVCNWFNKNGKWRNSILEEIENSAEVRSNLKHVVLLQYNRKEYAAWSDLDATLALYNMYMTGAADRSGSETYGYYQVPMLSDAQSAEFIKFKRYKKNYEEKLLDKFKDLVYQEIDRINLVKERATTDNHIDPIANFDMDDKKMGGAEFKFFPELNQKDQSGKTFLQAIDEAKKISMDEVDNLIKNTIKSIMDNRFNEAVQHYKDIGLYDRIGTDKNARFKYVNVYSEEGMNNRMREWFWNSTYFTSQFIELTTTDLAYYKNLEEFQKRNKQDHAPAERLNTLATWNGKPVLVNNDGSRRTVRRVIYLKDNILPANSMDSINEILEARVKDKDDAFTAYDKAAIMSIFSKVNVADAQAYNTLPSFRSTQIMAGMWSDAEETAYNNIMNNKWTASDFLVLWNTRKPYLYTQKNQPDGMGGIMKVPTQHKNSEFLLLTGAMFGQILHSSKLQALNDFMVKNNIDSAMFESAVKDGLQGTINLNDTTNYASTMAVLENATRINGKENPNVVHEFDYNDYGIQTSTPEHGIDKVQLVGTQIRRLISSDMNPNRDPNFKLKYKDREFTQEEWFNYFNAINTANIQEAFKEVSDKFNDIHEVEKELIREVRSNPRYGTDLIRALTLDKNGNFNIPLIDPSQTLRIQALLNSILKNRVTKQKINGGALIQASPFGLDEDKQPQIVYNEDGSIKYFEAYLPCPTEELYNALLDPNTHELDINKKDSKGNYIVPEKYREVIGYRV